MMEGSNGDFDTSSIYDLILWKKLTLAGVPCEGYTVKIGRVYATRGFVIEPGWEEIGPAEGVNMEQRRARLWKTAWGTLNWKYRAETHYEAYWKLLHKREQHVMNLHLQDPNERFKTGKCENCGATDTSAHAFITCPEVRKIWTTATKELERMLGRRQSLQIEYSEQEIVSAFPVLRETLPSTMRMRVVLWHSAVIYAITLHRETCIRNKPATDDDEGWEKIVGNEIKRVLWDIYEDFKENQEGSQFQAQWVLGKGLVELDGLGCLSFQ